LTEEEALTAIDRNCGEYGYTWENGSGKERYLERLARGLEKPATRLWRWPSSSRSAFLSASSISSGVIELLHKLLSMLAHE